MARTSIYEYTVAASGASATFAFANGEHITVYRDQLPQDVQDAAFWHGIKQKIADGAAIARDTETGRSASLDDKIYAMRQIARRLPISWNAISEGGSGNAGGWLLKALCELYPAKTREQLQAYLSGKSDKEKAALRADAKIAPVIQRLKDAAGASASKGIDTDSLLGELDD